MDPLLLFRIASRSCALPIRYVRETSRPLPVEPVPTPHPFVLGTALIRGMPTPVLDLRRLLGEIAPPPAGRMVSLVVEPTRRVAVLVDEVLGVVERPTTTLPPLLDDAALESVEAIGRLDGRLLTVLSAAGLIPEVVL